MLHLYQPVWSNGSVTCSWHFYSTIRVRAPLLGMFFFKRSQNLNKITDVTLDTVTNLTLDSFHWICSCQIHHRKQTDVLRYSNDVLFIDDFSYLTKQSAQHPQHQHPHCQHQYLHSETLITKRSVAPPLKSLLSSGCTGWKGQTLWTLSPSLSFSVSSCSYSSSASVTLPSSFSQGLSLTAPPCP